MGTSRRNEIKFGQWVEFPEAVGVIGVTSWVETDGWLDT